MSLKIVSEEDLRAALRPHQINPQAFEEEVRSRMAAASVSERTITSLVSLPPVLRGVAAYLPLSLLGCRETAMVAKVTSTSIGAKMIGYLAFPAISLFGLFGAAYLSALKIRDVQAKNDQICPDPSAQDDLIRRWWHNHQGAYGLVALMSFVATLWGFGWPLFLFYIVSFGILLYVIISFAKLGIGNRMVIGSACVQGLNFLATISLFTISDTGIHFLDQSLVPAVLWSGAVLIELLIGVGQCRTEPVRRAVRRPNELSGIGSAQMRVAFGLLFLVLLLAPTLWPATPSRIKRHAESFARAPYSSASWKQWEIPASWVVQSNMSPDFSKPRQVLDQELAGEQDPYVLGSALRVGLVSAEQIDQIKAYKESLHAIVLSQRGMPPQSLTLIEQSAWVIHAAVLRDDLTTADRDYLEQCLHATLQYRPRDSSVTLVDMLRATQLLEAIQRPVNPQRYREKIHDLLRELHTLDSGGYEHAGGFRLYHPDFTLEKRDWTQTILHLGSPGDVQATSHAIELMAIYGIPDGLDMNHVRSYLRPHAAIDLAVPDIKFIKAVTLNRLNQLPNIHHPTWLECLCYERTLLAAAVLTGLCIFATVSSPTPKPAKPTSASEVNNYGE